MSGVERRYCDFCLVDPNWMLLYQALSGHEGEKLLPKMVWSSMGFVLSKAFGGSRRVFLFILLAFLYMILPLASWDNPNGGSRMQIPRSVCQYQ